MVEFKPMSIDEKIYKAEQEMQLVQDEIEPLIDRKREIEQMLTEINEHKTQRLPDEQFAQVMKTRALLVKEKFGVEENIRTMNKKVREKNQEVNKLKMFRKKSPKDEMCQYLIELRDKYMSFSADTTRVSSMRAMSARFVEEIQALMKYFD